MDAMAESRDPNADYVDGLAKTRGGSDPAELVYQP
jgi:hypothetical protein